jgi:hypothetical protein
LIVTKYNPGDQIKKRGMGGHVARMEKRRSTYRIWWKTRRRWDVSKIDLEEKIGLVWHRIGTGGLLL